MPKNNELVLPTRDRGSITFRDKAFRSRTIVFEDGRTLAVENSTVVVSDEEQTAALDRHPDFERATDGS